MKIFYLEGSKVNNIESFYDEVQRVLCPGFDDFGRNLNAFDDVLYGGFGVYNYEKTRN